MPVTKRAVLDMVIYGYIVGTSSINLPSRQPLTQACRPKHPICIKHVIRVFTNVYIYILLLYTVIYHISICCLPLNQNVHMQSSAGTCHAAKRKQKKQTQETYPKEKLSPYGPLNIGAVIPTHTPAGLRLSNWPKELCLEEFGSIARKAMSMIQGSQSFAASVAQTQWRIWARQMCHWVPPNSRVAARLHCERQLRCFVLSCVKDLKVLLKASNIYNEQSHHYWYSVYSVHTCSFLILFLAPTGNAKQLSPRTDLGPLLGFGGPKRS